MSTDIFGRVHLGYLVVASRQIPAWRQFASEGIGVHVESADDTALTLRVDDHARRLIVTPGDAEDVLAIGMQLDGEVELNIALTRLREQGIEVTRHDGEAAALRGVAAFWSCTGPKRTQIELFTTATLTDRPLNMKTSGFITGAGGLGHMAITTREPASMQRFWESIFNARLSDHVEDRISGVDLKFTFLRLNERHHSVAIGATRGLRMNPVRTGIHHLALQAGCLDDVVQAYRRCRALGYPITSGIGQHPNDKELSFYVETPSGFEIEIGWNPLVIDGTAEQQWRATTYQGVSLWGHFPESLTLADHLRRIGRGVMSLTRREYTPGAAP